MLMHGILRIDEGRVVECNTIAIAISGFGGLDKELDEGSEPMLEEKPGLLNSYSGVCTLYVFHGHDSSLRQGHLAYEHQE